MAARTKPKAESSGKYEQRQLEVFRAAARTFNRLGFHIATLDDVAEDLGVTKPALYYYARSKDELLAACAQMALDVLEAALERETEAKLNGLQRLRDFFQRYAEVITEDFGRCLVLTEPRDLAPKSRKANVEGRRSLNHAVRAIIKDGIKDGSIAGCDERVLATMLFDAFNGLARWYNPKGPTPLAGIVEQYFGILLKGVGR